MQTDRSNRPRLEDVSAMSVAQIAALPAEHLALLRDDAVAALAAAQRLNDWLDGAITLRYGERAAGLRQQQGKDTGTVRFEDGDVAVVADLPKKVEWDQQQVAALVKRIRDSGEDPADYVDTSFKVPERKYTAWPASIREVFAPARTVRTGKPTFRLEIKENR
jgi:hypothetical protein